MRLFKKDKGDNEKKLTWSDITIGQFQKIYDLQKRQLDEDTLGFELLAVIEKTTVEQLMDLPVSEVRERMQKIRVLFTKPKTGLIKGAYMINGKKYRVFTNINDFTTAQYIDFNAMAKDYESHLPQFLSIFLIPDGKKYNNGYDIEVAQNEIANYLSVEEGLTIASFFSLLCGVSMKLMLRSSLRILKKNRKKIKDNPQLVEKMMDLEKKLKEMEGQISLLG